MTSIGSSLLAIAARMLQPEEREAALGDLTEAGESEWQGLADILGVVLYRQATLWTSWRPWLAGFGLTVPNSLMLMGMSVSVSRTIVRLGGQGLIDHRPLETFSDPTNLIRQIFLLAACAWVGGCVAASVSRRTFWASSFACALPCAFCLARFRIESIPAVSLFLFLPPAFLGARRGLTSAPIRLSIAIPLALAITILMLPMFIGGPLRGTCIALLWPAWYLVAAAIKPATEPNRPADPCRSTPE